MYRSDNRVKSITSSTMLHNEIEISACCAQGATFYTQMVPVREQVSLKVITFLPAEDSGQPPVLFVAGLISLITGWERVLREMTRDFKVYYVETREKVSSVVKGRASYTIEEIGKDLVSLVSILDFKPNKYILFGSSLGATAILDCCRFLKTPPLCLVLVGPNAIFQIPAWSYPILWFFPPQLYLLIKPVIRWYLRTFEVDTKSDRAQYEKYCGILEAADPWKLKKIAFPLARYSVWDRLDFIHYPTLIFGASRDTMHIPENLHKIGERMENATCLDMETNSKTHSAEMVQEMRGYISRLKTKTTRYV